MSFKVEFAAVENVDDSTGWAANGQRFATSREAEASAIELRGRVDWFKAHRVVECDDPVNYQFDFISSLSYALPDPIWVPGAPAEIPAETAPPEGTAITDVPPPVANVTPPTHIEAIHAEPEVTVAVDEPTRIDPPVEPDATVDVAGTEPAVPAGRKKKADAANTAS